MQSLQHKASEWSGVSTADAFTIDEAFKPWLPSLPISTTGCIYDDEEEWFRSIFANSQNHTSDIDDDSKIKLINFFSYTAYFLVAGVEQQDQNLHTPCKDAALKQHAPPM
ncbi:Two-on-two hemoglobin-3 [Glycine soja]|nr:Two-on-two hemoglobin-3 [Glycine max]